MNKLDNWGNAPGTVLIGNCIEHTQLAIVDGKRVAFLYDWLRATFTKDLQIELILPNFK